MPELVLSADPPRVQQFLEWDEYHVENGEILQHIVANHAERQGADVSFTANDLFVTLEDGNQQHRYRVGADGALMSGFSGPDVPVMHRQCLNTARRRHETITQSRMNALVSRANKTAELVDYVESFDAYDLAETVFEAYVDGPILDGAELEKAVLEQDGPETLETIKTERPRSFDQPAVSRIDLDDTERYGHALSQVAGSEEYVMGQGADVLDFEVCTKGRNMTDFYAENWKTRREYRDIYHTVLSAAAEQLDMEHLLERREHQLRYGIWPDYDG